MIKLYHPWVSAERNGGVRFERERLSHHDADIPFTQRVRTDLVAVVRAQLYLARVLWVVARATRNGALDFHILSIHVTLAMIRPDRAFRMAVDTRGRIQRRLPPCSPLLCLAARGGGGSWRWRAKSRGQVAGEKHKDDDCERRTHRFHQRAL